MKLPINPLLYLVSLASLGGIVHSVYKYTNDPLVYDAPALKKIKADNEIAKQKGASKDSKEGWVYSNAPFWQNLRVANFTGKVEVVEKAEPTENEVVKKPERELVDLDTVVEVIGITRAGEDTAIVVKYLIDVEVPKDHVVTATTPSVMATVPRGRRGRANITQPAAAASTTSPGGTPPHHMKIGDPLWPGYEYVFLKAVANDASHVVFELRLDDKKDPEKGYPTQNVIKGNLDLPADVLEKMRGGLTTNGGDTMTNNDVAKVSDSVWVDTPETTINKEGLVNISQKDQGFLETNGQDVWNDDVHMKDYAGGSGQSKIRGVQIRKLSSRVQQFGVSEGDVLISINGKPVTGMANAKKVGRRLYNSGVRSFRAEILRQGRIIIRTYQFKK